MCQSGKKYAMIFGRVNDSQWANLLNLIAYWNGLPNQCTRNEACIHFNPRWSWSMTSKLWLETNLKTENPKTSVDENWLHTRHELLPSVDEYPPAFFLTEYYEAKYKQWTFGAGDPSRRNYSQKHINLHFYNEPKNTIT